MRVLSRIGPDAPMLADLYQFFATDGEARPLVDDGRRREVKQWLAEAVGVDSSRLDLKSGLFGWPLGNRGPVLGDRVAVGIKQDAFLMQFALFVPIDREDVGVGMASERRPQMVGVTLLGFEMVRVPLEAVTALLERLNEPGRMGVISSVAIAQDGSSLFVASRDPAPPHADQLGEIGLRQPDGTYRWTSQKLAYREAGLDYEWASSINGPMMASCAANGSSGELLLRPDDGVQRSLCRLRVRPC